MINGTNGTPKKDSSTPEEQRVSEIPISEQLRKKDPRFNNGSDELVLTPISETLKDVPFRPHAMPTPTGHGELGQYDRGLYPLVDRDLNRARLQPTSSKIGRAAANIIPNIGLSLVEYAGGIGELGHYAMAELTDTEYQADFSNAMTELAKEYKNPFGEAYRRAPDEVFDLGDPAWWAQNVGGLLESAGSFLIAGAGVGKLALGASGKMAQAIGGRMGAGANQALSKAARLTGQGFTSTSLASMEASMSGAMVYEEIFENHYLKTGDPVEASRLASEGAASAFKISTALVSALNFTSVFPIFQTTNYLRRASKWGLNRKPGESSREFVERMVKMGKDPEAPIRGLYDRMGIPLEMAQESAQEVSNIFAEEVGKQSVGQGVHETSGMELWFDMLQTEEGILGAVLGAAGGGLQTIGMRNLPMHRRAARDDQGNIRRDEQGNAIVETLSSRQLERVDEDDAGISYAKSLERDIREVMDAQQRLEKALQEGNDVAAEAAKFDLFDVSAKRSIPIDGGRALQASIEEMMNIDNSKDLIQEIGLQAKELQQQKEALAAEGAPDDMVAEVEEQIQALLDREADIVEKFPGKKVITEAMAMGLADDVQDNAYKETARQKLQEIDEIREDYIDTISRYDFGDEQTVGLGEYVFGLKQRRNRARSNIDRIDTMLAQYEAQIDSISNDLLPEALRESAESPSALLRMSTEREALKETRRQLNEDFKEAKKGNLHMQEKYGQLDKEGTVAAIRKQIKDTTEEIDKYNATMNENMESLAEEYMGTLDDRQAYINGLTEKKKQQKMLNELSRRVGYVESGKGRDDSVKKLQSARQSEIEKQQQLTEAAKKRAAKKQEDEAIKRAEKAEEERKKNPIEQDPAKKGKTKTDDVAGSSGAVGIDADAGAIPVTSDNESESETTDTEIPEASGDLDLTEFEGEGDQTADGSGTTPVASGSDQSTEGDTTEDSDTESTSESEGEGKGKESGKVSTKPISDSLKEESPSKKQADEEAASLKRKGKNKKGVTDDQVKNPEVESEGVLLKLIRKAQEVYVKATDPNFKPKSKEGYKIATGFRRLWDWVTNSQGKKEKSTVAGKRISPENPRVDSVYNSMKGEEVTLSVDTEYDDQVYDENMNLTDEIPTDAHNIPIAIRDSEGTLIGYLPQVNWLSYQADGEYKNVLDYELKSGERNAEVQIRTLKRIREKVVKGDINTIVKDVKLGVPIYNYTSDGKRQSVDGDKALPDPNLKFSVVKHGMAQGQFMYANEGTLVANMNHPTPVWVKKVPPAHITIFRKALLAKYTGDAETIEAINEVVGGEFDFASAEGLSRLMDKITYSRRFEYEEDVMNGDPTDYFFFADRESGNIYISRGQDAVYTTDRKKAKQEGYLPLVEQNVEGELVVAPEALEFLSNLSSQIEAKKLNTADPYTELTIDENDNISSKQHENYNAYVKSRITTYIDGTNTIEHEDGHVEYLYNEQNTNLLDVTRILGEEANPIQPKKEPKKPTFGDHTEELVELTYNDKIKSKQIGELDTYKAYVSEKEPKVLGTKEDIAGFKSYVVAKAKGRDLEEEGKSALNDQKKVKKGTSEPFIRESTLDLEYPNPYLPIRKDGGLLSLGTRSGESSIFTFKSPKGTGINVAIEEVTTPTGKSTGEFRAVFGTIDEVYGKHTAYGVEEGIRARKYFEKLVGQEIFQRNEEGEPIGTLTEEGKDFMEAFPVDLPFNERPQLIIQDYEEALGQVKEGRSEADKRASFKHTITNYATSPLLNWQETITEYLGYDLREKYDVGMDKPPEGYYDEFYQAATAIYNKAKEAIAKDVVTQEKGIDTVFERASELSDIGSKQQYAEYLATIFPDSKIPDILYHGTDQEFEQFTLDNFGKSSSVTTDMDIEGVSLSGDPRGAKMYGKNILPVVVDTRNPTGKVIEYDEEADKPVARWKDFDTYLDPNSTLFGGQKPINDSYEIVIKDPNQIHILGTQADIQGFREFVGGDSQQESLRVGDEWDISNIDEGQATMRIMYPDTDYEGEGYKMVIGIQDDGTYNVGMFDSKEQADAWLAEQSSETTAVSELETLLEETGRSEEFFEPIAKRYDVDVLTVLRAMKRAVYEGEKLDDMVNMAMAAKFAHQPSKLGGGSQRRAVTFERIIEEFKQEPSAEGVPTDTGIRERRPTEEELASLEEALNPILWSRAVASRQYYVYTGERASATYTVEDLEKDKIRPIRQKDLDSDFRIFLIEKEEGTSKASIIGDFFESIGEEASNITEGEYRTLNSLLKYAFDNSISTEEQMEVIIPHKKAIEELIPELAYYVSPTEIAEGMIPTPKNQTSLFREEPDFLSDLEPDNYTPGESASDVQRRNNAGNGYADNETEEFGFSVRQKAAKSLTREMIERYEIEGLSRAQIEVAVDNIVFLLGDQILSSDMEVTVSTALSVAYNNLYTEAKNQYALGNEDRAQNIAKVLSNWNRFSEQAIDKLEVIGYTAQQKELEGEDSNYEKTKYDSGARWYQSNKDTASSNLKLFFSTIPNQDYADPVHDTYEEEITELADDEIMVFGSNPEGRHGYGAAAVAKEFGAERGKGRGIMGQTYGIVTKNLKKGFTEESTGKTYSKVGERSVSKDEIAAQIAEMYEYAKRNPDKKFKVAYMEDGKANLNGYSNQELGEMFSRHPIPENIVFEEGFSHHIDPEAWERTLQREASQFLGLETYLPVDTIWEKLTAALADAEPNFENYMEILDQEGRHYAPFKAVRSKLLNLPEDSSLQDEFMKSMSNQYVDMIVALIQPKYDRDGLIEEWTYKPINSDRSTAIRMIADEWVENAKNDSPFVKEENGILRMDEEAINEYKDSIIKKLQYGGPGIANVRPIVKQMLQDIGVRLQPGTWDDILRVNANIFTDEGSMTSAFRITNGQPTPNSFLALFFNSLQGGEFEQNNPLTDGSLTQRLNKIAFREYLNSDKIITTSFRDISGNIIHPYQMNTQVSDKIRNLKTKEEFRENLAGLSFSRTSLWLSRPDEVSLEYVDGISNQQTKNKQESSKLGSVDTDLMAAVMYFGTVSQTRGNAGRYQSTTKADKTRSPMYKAPRVPVVTRMDGSNVVGFRNKELKKVLRGAIISEFSRIVEFREVSKKLKEAEMDLGPYQEGASKFILFPELNAEFAQEYVGTAITQAEYDHVWESGDPYYDAWDLDAETTYSSLDIMMKVVEARLVRESQEILEAWKESGIVRMKNPKLAVEGTAQIEDGAQDTSKVKSHMLDGKYMRFQNPYKDTDKMVSYAAADFTVNQFIASVNEFQIVSGDPANYWKKSKEGGLREDLKATMENINKRLAGDIAPKSKGRYDSPTFTMIGIQDPEVHAREREILGEAYADMEIADAQEYTTVQEHLDNMRAEGRISEKKHAQLSAKIKPGEYYDFTTEELATIFSPTKPVYRGNKHFDEYDVNLEFYVKSSAFPLLPQMLDGFQLDRLRKKMETYVDDDAGIQGIRRASFGTANKLAMVNPVKLFKDNDREIVDDFDLSNAVMQLDRDGFGFQQDVPVKDKREINLVSQANKLLFNGIRNVEGFEFEGEKFNGRDLENKKQGIRKALLRRAEQELSEKMGLGIDANGDMMIESFSKIKDLLKREAKDRGWSLGAIDSLELNKEKNGFIIPLGLSPNSNAIESLILAQISNITRRETMHGYSYVQGSSAGLIKYKDFKPKEHGFVPTKQFNPEGLRFLSTADGKTQPADIIIPWDYRDAKGNLLDINNFKDENGIIDEELLPEEARKIIGMRIPNQGHSSMLPMRVVGFIDPGTTLAIVPEEIVAQMGSDFDVDKLYTYQPKLQYEEYDGSLNRDDRKLSEFGRKPRIMPVPENVELDGQNFLNMMLANKGTQSMSINGMTVLGMSDYLVAQMKGEPSTSVHKQLKDLLVKYSDQTKTIHMDNVIASVKESFSEGMSMIPGSYDANDQLEIADEYDNVPTEFLQNKYIDIFQSVMEHEQMFDRLKSPLEKSDLSDEKKAILEKLDRGGEVRSPASYIGQRNYKINQKSAQTLVGIFALANNLNSVIQDTKRVNLTLQETKVINKQREKVPMSIKVKMGEGDNAYDIELSTLSGEGVSMYNGEERTKGDNISLSLSASVDNANMNILGHINWNEDTANAVVAMLLAQSPDTTNKKGEALSLGYVAKFMSQPIIHYIVDESNRLQSSAQTEIIIDPLKTAIKKFEEGLERLAKKKDTKLTNPTISESAMENMLGKAIPQMTGEEISAQMAILQMFKTFNDVAEDIRKIQQVFLRPDTKGIDNRVIQALRQIEDFENIRDKGLDNIAGVEGLMSLTDGTPSEEAVVAELIYNNSYRIINELMPEYITIYKKITDTMQEELNRKFSNDKLTSIWKGTKRYLNSFVSEMNIDEDVDSLYRRLLYGTEDQPSLATRVRKAKNSWGKKDYFLKRLQVETAVDSNNPSLISFKASKAARLDDSNNVLSLAYMLESTNEEEANLAKDLVLYSLITGGVQGANEFIKYVPPSHLAELGVTEAYSKASESGMYEHAVPQILMHNPSLALNISLDSDDVQQIIYSKEVDGQVDGIRLKAPNPSESGLAYYTDGKESYPEYVSMYDVTSEEVRLFKYKGVDSKGNYIYQKAPKLGYEYISEYRAGKEVNESTLNQKDHADYKSAGMVHKPGDSTETEPSKKAVLQDMYPGREITNDLYKGDNVPVIEESLEGALKMYEGTITAEHMAVINAVKAQAKDVKILLGDFGYSKEMPASYTGGDTHTIRIDVTKTGSDVMSETIAHEIVHAATVNAIKNPDIDTSSLQTLYALSIRKLKNEGFDYELKDIYEFVSYAMTNKRFQAELNEIEFSGDKSLLDRFKDLISKIVSTLAEISGINVKSDSVLENTINEVVAVGEKISKTEKDERNPTVSRDEDYIPTATNEGLDIDESEFNVSFEKMEPAVKEAINQIESRRSAIKAKISSTDDEGLKVQLKGVLDRLQANVQELRDKNSAEAIKEVAQDQAKFVKEIANNRDLSFSVLLVAKKVAESWDIEVTREFLTRGQKRIMNPIRQAFIDAQGIMGGPLQDLDRTIYQKVAQTINTRLPDKYKVQVEDLKSMEDIGLPTKYFLDLSQVNNFLAKYMFEKVTTTASNAEKELQEFDEKLSEFEGKLSAEEMEGLKQTDKDGNWTRNLIDEYSFEYQWRTRNLRKKLNKKLREAETEEKGLTGALKKQAFKEFHRDMNALQETVDIRMLIFDKFASPQWKSRKAYIKHLEDEYGEAKAAQMIASAKQKYNEYISRKQDQKYIFETEYDVQGITDTTKEKWVEQQMQEWIDLHSPVEYLNDRFGVIGQGGSKFTATAGQKFTAAVPRKTDRKGFKTGYYDPKFEELNEAQREFYDFYVKNVSKFTSYLPNYHARNIDRNFLPRIQKSVTEAYAQGGMQEALKVVNTNFTDSLTTGEAAELNESALKSFQEFDPKTGAPKKEIKVLFTQEDAVDTEDLSFDLGRVLRMYGAMSLNYKWMSSIEDEMNIGMNIIKNSRKIEKTGGVPVVKGDGSPVEIRNGNVNLTESAQYLLDALMYGEIRRESGASKITLFDSWNIAKNMDKRNTMKEIENERDALEADRDAGIVTGEAYDEQMKVLEQRYRDVGGKNLVWSKAGDWALKVTQLKGMGYNMTAGIANVGFGVLSNMTWAASGLDFTGSELASAYGELAKGIFSKNLKIPRIVKEYNVLFEVNEVEYGKSGDKGKRNKTKTYTIISDKIHPYYIQRTTEFTVQGTSLVAQMKHTKLTVLNKKTGKQEEVTLYDVYGKDGKWNEEVYERPDEWKPPTSTKETFNKYTEFRNKVIQLNKYLHGNYDPKSPILAKAYLLGRMAMNFRSWVPYGFKQRISEEHYDQQLGREYKGRYRTLYDIGIMKSIKGVFGSMIHAYDFAYGEEGSTERLKDIDIANVKMALREMQIVAGIVAAQVMLKGMIDEDDDDNSWGSFTAHILINQLYRVEQDVYFYLSPRTFEEILRNPLPVMQTYTDFQKAFDSSMSYLLESDFEGERVLLDWGRSMPVSNQLIKNRYLGSNIIE